MADRGVDIFTLEIDRAHGGGDIGKALLESRQARHEPAHGEGRHHADGEDALFLIVVQFGNGVFDSPEAFGQAGQQCTTVASEGQALVGAQKQGYAQRCFQAANLMTDRGRGYIQFRCSGA